MLAMAALTAGLLTRGELRRAAMAARLASSAAWTAARPWLSAVASTRSSSSFCFAKASQDFTSASSFCSLVQIDRHMQQRARRCDPQTLAQALRPAARSQSSAAFKVGLPDVAAINDAQRKDFIGRQQIEQTLHFAAGIDRVDVQTSHGQVGGQMQVPLQSAEVGGQQKLPAARLEVVGTPG